MKKNIMALLITVSMLSITACGKQETTATTESISTTVEPTQVENTVTEETVATETTTETEKVENTEVTDNIVYPDVNPEDVDPKTTNMDAETAHALGKQEHAEIQEKYGSVDDWIEYAKSQGADSTGGWCWIYYTGQGAGSEESYAVYMKEDSARYKEVFHLGDYLPDGTLFTGANNDEMSTADNRVLLRMSENGELGGTTVTQDENGMLNIIVE